MIVFYTGIPGSGKTYNAVYSIFNNFSDNPKAKKDLKKDYKNCFTNINGFNFDTVNNVLSLNEIILDEQLKELHKIYLDTKKLKNSLTSIDDVLIDKCKEYNIYKTLFVIDEAHNYFDTQKAHLVWWLTYHRHLHHDIVLITQNLSLINAKYKIAETYYKAVPTSLKLFNNTFSYHAYVDSRMTQSGKFATIKIPKHEEVFALYQSGDTVKTRNVIKKFLIISLIALISLFILGYFFIHSKDQTQDQTKEIKNIHSHKNIKSIKEDEEDIKDQIDIQNMVYDTITCSTNSCSIDDYSYPKQVLFKLLKNYKLQILDEIPIIDTFTTIHLLIDKNYKQILKRPEQQEEQKEDKTPTDIVNNLFKKDASL